MDLTFWLITIFVMGLNGLWYWMKIILKNNGYKISWFGNHLQDIPNLIELGKKTESLKEKRKYKLILWGLLIGFIVFLIIIFFTFSNI